MANTNLAQHEQILKSLEQSLKEIGDQHKLVYESLAKLHTSSRQAWDDVNAAWSKIVKLFTTIEELRSTRLKFEQEAH